MAHHVCPRSSARLIEEVNAFVKIDLSNNSIRKDTKHKAKGTKLIGERASFVPVFRFRANPISTRSLYATIRSQALSNSPVELDKGKKKNTAGTLYYDYTYTPENETTRARRDFLSSPLFSPLSLLFSFFISSVIFDRHAASPGTNVTSAPHRECFSVVSSELDGHSGRILYIYM